MICLVSEGCGLLGLNFVMGGSSAWLVGGVEIVVVLVCVAGFTMGRGILVGVVCCILLLGVFRFPGFLFLMVRVGV